LANRIRKSLAKEGMNATFASKKLSGVKKWSDFENTMESLVAEVANKKNKSPRSYAVVGKSL